MIILRNYYHKAVDKYSGGLEYATIEHKQNMLRLADEMYEEDVRKYHRKLFRTLNALATIIAILLALLSLKG